MRADGTPCPNAWGCRIPHPAREAQRRRWKQARTSNDVEALAGLAADDDPLVRAEVAGRPWQGGEMLTGLAADPDSSVRGRVASNPYAPPSVLVVLAADPDEWVRAKAAENPDTPAAGRAAGGLLAD